MPGTLSTLTALDKSFLKLRIIQRLALVTDSTLFGCQVIQGLKSPASHDGLIADCFAQMKDNIDLMVELISEDTCLLIFKYYTK